MPLLLEKKDLTVWLNSTDVAEVQSLIKPYAEGALVAYTVRRLRGKEAVGNRPEAAEMFPYEGLKNYD
jgi:putative SOS response-associated peptidase YedK